VLALSSSRLLWILAALLFSTVALVAWIKVGSMLDPEVALVAPLALVLPLSSLLAWMLLDWETSSDESSFHGAPELA
jgi:hypothetical protein